MENNNEYNVEKNYIEHMQILGYEYVELNNYSDVLANFRKQICRFNSDRLIAAKGTAELSDAEFRRLLSQIENFTVIQAAQHWQSSVVLELDNEKTVYIHFSSPNEKKNVYQIAHQITMCKEHKNRYDVTLLINGLPIVQTELKRPSVDFTEAIHQVNRYRKNSYSGLFNFLQLFIVSNETVTKYFCNQNLYVNGQLNIINASSVFYWLNENNERIIQLDAFADAILNPARLTEILYKYMIIKSDSFQMIVMRPYQIYEVEAGVKRVLEDNSNGYIAACTGSGKTLTSFKMACLLKDSPSIDKVIFLIDRKDLDDQTVSEYNSFENGCVDYTDNTCSLIKQLEPKGRREKKLVITTIQKMAQAVKSNNKKIQKIISLYQRKKVVFIIDECHRSQFGKMNTDIQRHFQNANYIGFTGTPIYEQNRGNCGLTTADIFKPADGLNACLHQYMMKDAIADSNILPFQVEYIRTVFGSGEGIDAERLDDPEYCSAHNIDMDMYYHDETRMRKIMSHIFMHHQAKRQPQGKKGMDLYTALFAVDSIKSALAYYEIAQEINAEMPDENKLNFAVIFTTQDNKDMENQNQAGPEELEACMKVYNKTFGTDFDRNTFDAYRKDISNRLKQNSDKQVDILIVVDMFLTGFDAKPLNTLYLDKNLKWHGLIQAYSRTNRTFRATKRCGNIVTYRNIKKYQDEALALFSGNGDPNVCLKGDYNSYLKDWSKYVSILRHAANTPDTAGKLKGESEKRCFIEAFRNVMRTLKQLDLFTVFTWDDLNPCLTKSEYEAYEGVYKRLRDELREPGGEPSSLVDIDFETELIGTDRVNFDYIMSLLTQLRSVQPESKRTRMLERLLSEYECGDDEISKEQKYLLKKFIKNRLNDLPEGLDEDEMYAAFCVYKKGLAKKEIKEFAEKTGSGEDAICEVLKECKDSGEVLVSACSKITKSIKGTFRQRKEASEFVKVLVRRYAM